MLVTGWFFGFASRTERRMDQLTLIGFCLRR